MFDVDNFYEIVRCRYAYPKTVNFIERFRENGSKDVVDTVTMTSDEFLSEFDKIQKIKKLWDDHLGRGH